MIKAAYISLLFLLIAGTLEISSAQDNKASRADRKEQRQWEREKKKEIKEREREQLVATTKILIENQQFVLKADYLSNNRGQRVPVSNTINFILIDSLEATIQLGSAFSMGYNGVGGETVDGRITKYEYFMTGKNKSSFSLGMVFMSSVGIYDITMTVNPEGYANASIRGNWAGALNYHGRLVSLNQSRIYKGHPRY